MSLGGSAMGIVLVALAEGLGAAKTYASRDHYDVDADRELVGLGAANVAAGLSSGMVVNGSLSKTAVNGTAGAHSQLSGLLAGALTVLTLLFLTGFFADLPDASLAAVVIAAVAELVDVRTMTLLYRSVTGPLRDLYGPAARADFVASVFALFGVLVFDTLPGLFIGIGLSVLLIVYRASRPHVAELGADTVVPGRFVDLHADTAMALPGIAVLRVEGGLFFANADSIRGIVRTAARRPSVRGVVLDTESIPAMDVTAAQMVFDLVDELRETGVALVMARERGRAGDVVSVAEPRRATIKVYPTIRAALEALEAGGDDRGGFGGSGNR